jgi:hypothetical protein
LILLSSSKIRSNFSAMRACPLSRIFLFFGTFDNIKG